MALADEAFRFIPAAAYIVAEVVRLIDDNQIVVAPINGFQINIASETGLATEIRVGKRG